MKWNNPSNTKFIIAYYFNFSISIHKHNIPTTFKDTCLEKPLSTRTTGVFRVFLSLKEKNTSHLPCLALQHGTVAMLKRGGWHGKAGGGWGAAERAKGTHGRQEVRKFCRQKVNWWSGGWGKRETKEQKKEKKRGGGEMKMKKKKGKCLKVLWDEGEMNMD